MKSYIWITTQFEGFHYWKDAPDDVGFLRNEHRHIFKCKIYISVNSFNREIEFFQFQRFINSLTQTNSFNFMSCEMISNSLYEKIVSL